jgi:aspartyl protease family protein
MGQQKLIAGLLLAWVVAIGQAADVSVTVIALFADKALLKVDGKQKIVTKGETFEGVKLISASGRGAVVEINGKSLKLGLNQSIAGNFKKPERNSMKIYPDSLGMYYVDGLINKQSTRFLVDTGASFVTMSGKKARALSIDFRKGTRSTAQTASAVIPVWQIRLKSVSVGGIQIRDVDAMVIEGDQPFEVLLGNSYLRHMRIQQAGSVLEIQKRF